MTNTFAEIDTVKDISTGKRTAFMRLTDGNKYIIRILEPKATRSLVHFIGGVSVQCPGNECPICKSNFDLVLKLPDSYRGDPRWNPQQKRYLVNVLDKTPVRKCECGQEYEDLQRNLCDCGKPLSSAAPSNTVKVLAKGVTLFSQFNGIEAAVVGADGNPVGITNYDIILVVSGKGKDTKITAIPDTAHISPLTEKYELYDLKTLFASLSPDEMVDLARGVSLRDIYAARRAQEAAEAPAGVISPDSQAAIEKAVKELFS